MQRPIAKRSSSLNKWLSRPPSLQHRRSLRWLVAACLLISSGCSLLGSGVTKPFANIRPPFGAKSNGGDRPRLASIAQVAAPTTNDDAARPTDRASIAETQASSDAHSGPLAEVVPAAYTVSAPEAFSSHKPESACFAETCSAGCGNVCAVCAGPNVARKNAQEYIFDGGDQQPTVVVREDWSTEGIDATDTVAYYETADGLVCVKPTNRVPIYAPRFGAVRQVRGAMLATRAVGTERVLAPVKPGRFDETDLAGTVMQPVAPVGEEQVKLIDAFQENQLGTPVEQIIPPSRVSEARVPFENIDVLATGRITDEEIAVLGEFLQNARTWFKPELLEIMVNGREASLLTKVKSPQDVHVYQPPGDKCALRICKTASHTLAESGDIIRFTIRFDNAGVTPIQNAVILDSLSPRLEYIEGSQQCSVNVRFSAEPNEVGSQILKWEIAASIEPSDGGTISFDCRVR